jgi:hypothetical protein
VPYAGEAPYGAPYTGEPYYPDGGYGTAGSGGYGTAGTNPAAAGYGPAEANLAAGGHGSAGANSAAGGHGSAEANPAAAGYGPAEANPAAGGSAGGYGAAGPYRPADHLAGEPEKAAGHSSDDAPGPGERPERDGQPGQPAGLLAGDAPRASAPDVTAATAEVCDEAVPAEHVSPDVSGWNEDVPDESGPDEDVRDESGDDEDLPGKHMLASGMPAGKDDPLGRDVQPDLAPRPHDGPVPGPRYGSAPDGPDWPPAGSARLATADPGQEPPAAAQPAEDVPGGPPTSADRPADPASRAGIIDAADPASRASITDTMAAELAGWAAGELPGQAAARLASWAAAGGAVARGRQQTSIGGGTATERVS